MRRAAEVEAKPAEVEAEAAEVEAEAEAAEEEGQEAAEAEDRPGGGEASGMEGLTGGDNAGWADTPEHKRNCPQSDTSLS